MLLPEPHRCSVDSFLTTTIILVLLNFPISLVLLLRSTQYELVAQILSRARLSNSLLWQLGVYIECLVPTSKRGSCRREGICSRRYIRKKITTCLSLAEIANIGASYSMPLVRSHVQFTDQYIYDDWGSISVLRSFIITLDDPHCHGRTPANVSCLTLPEYVMATCPLS